jgi:enamine deaminase RidA (YjgF/YER057c/UK114 family)
MTSDPAARLQQLGLGLPQAPAAIAAYVPTCLVPLSTGRVMVFISGQILRRDGQPVQVGRVPDEVTLDDATANARGCALNVLAQLDEAVGLSNVEQMAQVTVFVRADGDFGGHPAIANGASQLFIDVLGEAGRHARAAIGVSSLPFGVPVEVAAVAVARRGEQAV